MGADRPGPLPHPGKDIWEKGIFITDLQGTGRTLDNDLNYSFRPHSNQTWEEFLTSHHEPADLAVYDMQLRTRIGDVMQILKERTML